MRPVAVFDIEIYPDYLLVMLREVETRKTLRFEMYEGQPLDRAGLLACLRKYELVSFNGRNFDMPILMLALGGRPVKVCKRAADDIIEQGLKPWDIEREYDIKLAAPYIAHIDLIEVAPGQASLKLYGGRLHTRKLQDLPYSPSEPVIPDKREALIEYCGNDLDLTIELYKHLLPQIELRKSMSAQYKIDLCSKSDAQIAEAVIKQEVEARKGGKISRHEVNAGTVFHYTAPEWLKFRTQRLRDVRAMVCAAQFRVSAKGSVEMPPELAEAQIRVGEGVYRMGIGGLHSSETTVAHVADDDHVLIDRDVASYYPAIILGAGLAPENMGRDFLAVYKGIVDRRLEAKRLGDKVVADALKICVNGSFGKLGSKWSILYAPHLLIQVTLTGQLALLMLIENIEHAGLQVVSANTDGLVIHAHRSQIDALNRVVAWWEKQTGFQTEETRYAALYSRDVNSYIALKEGGGVKLKGAYAPTGLSKNPQNAICIEAAVEYLANGTPLDVTICCCTDIRKFVTVRRVTGGAQKNGTYLGRVVRWYYANGVVGDIHYVTNGNKVGRSDGAKPLMELPDRFPNDINYGWYVEEALSLLRDVGADA